MVLKADAIFGDPKRILLELSGQHHLPDLLQMAARRLAENRAIVLVRVWMLRPPVAGDCEVCQMAQMCANRNNCLHLAASYGQSVVSPDQHWTELNGSFRRFPLGVRKVGEIAAKGLPLEDMAVDPGAPWIAQPKWVRSELVRAFLGLPLIFRGETLGVIVVFARDQVGDSCREWLHMIADHLAAAIANARAIDEIESLKRRLELENEYLREEVKETAFGELIGNSPPMTAVAQQIDLVAPTNSSVLILGESGTGKELVAREIHRRSNRAGFPLIKVNCAAVPRELYESEFFGHIKGSFTGAFRDRLGRFELADRGTLFLDEIGEIPLDLQSKLLRVLQEGELERIGEERTRKVDVRIIAATNRNLRDEAAAGRFRQDLFYRLSVFPIEMPPLRERLTDIPLLAESFLNKYARQLGRKKLRLTLASVQDLQRYDWPGNVRELQHVMERAAIISSDGRLKFDLPSSSSVKSRQHTSVLSNVSETVAVGSEAGSLKVLTDAEIRELEAQNIRRALAATNGKLYGKDGAASMLGVKPTTLASRIKALKIKDYD